MIMILMLNLIQLDLNNHSVFFPAVTRVPTVGPTPSRKYNFFSQTKNLLNK